LIFYFQSRFDVKIFIAIMIAIEKQFRINQTLKKIIRQTLIGMNYLGKTRMNEKFC